MIVKHQIPVPVKGFHPFIPEGIVLAVKHWCSNLSVFHDMLQVITLLLEGPDLIPIGGILRGGGGVGESV
jgi:hypothetical protein